MGPGVSVDTGGNLEYPLFQMHTLTGMQTVLDYGCFLT